MKHQILYPKSYMNHAIHRKKQIDVYDIWTFKTLMS